MTSPPALHPLCIPLSGLLGTWRGEGRGVYPTIAAFGYGEEITFSHNGKPFVAYQQRTWALEASDAGPAGRPLHAETGYLRPQPASGPAIRADSGEPIAVEPAVIAPVLVEVVIVMPTGHLELGSASWMGTGSGGTGILRSEATVTSTPTAKPVTATVRELTIGGDELTYTLAMAAVGLRLQHHLAATLRRLTS